jgi:lipopolysaccharide export system protein LptC
MILRKLDQGGELKYTLHAAEVRHYPDDDTTDLVHPRLVRQNREDDEPPVTISGDRAHITGDNEQVDLYDNVRIYRPSVGKYEELTAVTDMLTVFPDDETAFTKSLVLITQGRSWVKGVGMRVNSREQTYRIESRAVGFLESKYARKKRSWCRSVQPSSSSPSCRPSRHTLKRPTGRSRSTSKPTGSAWTTSTRCRSSKARSS